MASIYNDDGVLDYMAAAAELRGLRELGNPAAQATAASRIAAAAAVDVAASLNALVGILSVALEDGQRVTPGDDIDAEGDEQVDDVTINEPDADDPLDVGDWVRPLPVADGSGEQVGHPSLVIAVGQSEGADWLTLRHYDDDGNEFVSVGGDGARVWADNYRRAEEWQRVGPVGVSLATGQAVEVDADEVNPSDLIDDIDSDFGESTADDSRHVFTTPDEEPTAPKKSKGKSKSKGAK